MEVPLFSVSSTFIDSGFSAPKDTLVIANHKRKYLIMSSQSERRSRRLLGKGDGSAIKLRGTGEAQEQKGDEL